MRFSAQRLQQAITRREFMPFYQAICHSATGAVAGCEVLVRWRHPEKGLLRAGLFIDSVESAGMEYALMRMLMDEVLADIRRLLPVPQRPFLLTFNVSPGLVMAPVSRHWLLALCILLRQAGVTPVTEITERQDIRLYPGAAEEFAQLVQHGLQFAVDDFGAGHTGRHLPGITQAAFIKTDRRFTADPTDPASVRFIDDTVRLARVSGARVIAEGVETARQAAALRARGVDYLQGYHCGAPMPAGLFYYPLGTQPVPAHV